MERRCWPLAVGCADGRRGDGAVCGGAGRVAGVVIVVGTLHAVHGYPSPGAALLRFVLTFEDPPDATGVDRLIVLERRAQLGQQRRDYIKAMAADLKATAWSVTFEVAAP